MIPWTETVPIPQIDFSPASGPCSAKRKSAVINGKIWFVYGSGRLFEKIVVFDIESYQVSTINVPTPDGYCYECVTSEGDYLYILIRNRTDSFKLLTYDTKSLSILNTFNMNVDMIPMDIQVIDDVLHFISFGEGIPMTKIGLSRHFFVDKKLTADDQKIGNLIRNNNDLHLLTFNRKKLEVATIDENCVAGNTATNARIKWKGYYDGMFLTNGTMVTVMTNNVTSEIVVETYDFENRTWQQDMADDFFKYEDGVSVLAAEQIQDKIYIFTRLDGWHSQYEIRVLNIKPSLVEICLLNITKYVLSGEGSLESIRNQLPFELRCQLESMINSRVANFSS